MRVPRRGGCEANPRVVNAPLLVRVSRQVALTGDEELVKLHQVLGTYPGFPMVRCFLRSRGREGVLGPLRLHRGDVELTLFSMIATFVTTLDVTLAELAVPSYAG